MIDEYVSRNTHKAIAFTSLGQLRYLSALQYVDAMVGNSSSGIAEAPSFKIATIDIGDRQKGRLKAKSVLETKNNTKEIETAFRTIYSTEFQSLLQTTINPYGDGCVSQKIISILKDIKLDNILKKTFYNIEMDIK
jgi:GDP/UDP-N,N'-diacetylbacillosamine 2-epimerase (hydrolysing)